jgi:hypothetical protein
VLRPDSFNHRQVSLDEFYVTRLPGSIESRLEISVSDKDAHHHEVAIRRGPDLERPFRHCRVVAAMREDVIPALASVRPVNPKSVTHRKQAPCRLNPEPSFIQPEEGRPLTSEHLWAAGRKAGDRHVAGYAFCLNDSKSPMARVAYE